MQYEVDSFTPSDGRIVYGSATDHVAWLKGTGAKPSVHMLVQFSSRGVSESDARAIVDKITAALSA